MSPRRDAALLAARKIFSNRYSGADVAFVAGSIIRGDDTSYSDIDLVVVYPQLPAAYRESFLSDGFPVEAFVHDFSTLKYFFEDIDAKSGCPSLPSMVVEGVALPNEDSAEPFRRFASELLKKGPAMLEVQDIANRRYFITDLLDDLREPRNRAEALATGIRLYEMLADFFLRSKRVWSAKGKTIPRKLVQVDPLFAARFEAAFEYVFQKGETHAVILLAEEVLQPFGGTLFDGHKLDAPNTWRK